MSISKNRIQVVNGEGYAYQEKDAGETGIYPGMLLKLDTDGDVIKHDSAGGKVPLRIALEDSLQGNLVSTVYTINNPVRIMIFRPGEQVLVRAAAGFTYSIGEQLISAGNGNFKSATDSGLSDVTSLLECQEALDLSGESAVVTLIHALVI